MDNTLRKLFESFNPNLPEPSKAPESSNEEEEEEEYPLGI